MNWTDLFLLMVGLLSSFVVGVMVGLGAAENILKDALKSINESIEREDRVKKTLQEARRQYEGAKKYNEEAKALLRSIILKTGDK